MVQESGFQFASVWEAIADSVPRRDALVCGETRVTWQQFESRAARVAGFLDAHGIRSGAKLGLCLHNSNAYLEAQFGAFKARAVPVNVNYRYQADELVQLLDNADAEAVFFHGRYASRMAAIRPRLPKVKVFVQVDDGTEPLLEGAHAYEELVTSAPAMARVPRSGDDIYMLYTGGTTGMPRGVMYQHRQLAERMLKAAKLHGVAPPQALSDVPRMMIELATAHVHPVSLPACPLMHGTGMWGGALAPLSLGGTVVTIPELGLDPDRIWSEVERNRCTDLVIVGDAFGKPLLEALQRARSDGRTYDLSSLQAMRSSGVMWSAEVKRGLLEHLDVVLYDSMASTEGPMGQSVTRRGQEAQEAQTARFRIGRGVKVLDGEDREVQPGSGQRGKLALSRMVPLGYYKDAEKSAATFRTIDGVRYSLPGDYATVETDGSITLLGRGSHCINTAGEKVYPEEVEEALKRHRAIHDCLVVGMEDPRFGQRVVAVAEREPGTELQADELIEATRVHLASYKLPREVVFVPRVQRAASGKADYAWARRAATATT